MKEFYFDTEARIQAWIEADTEEEAIGILRDKLHDLEGLKFTIESYVPEKITELEEVCDGEDCKL